VTAVVDAFATPLFWHRDQAPAFLTEAAEKTFRVPLDEVFRERTPDDLVAEMDAAGIDRAVVHAVSGRLGDVAAFLRQHPSRFALSTEVDPRDGMAAVHAVHRAVVEFGAVLIRVVPFVVGAPATQNIYYPVFAKCAELGVAVSVHTGMSPLAVAARHQHPLHLDEVALFFPELRIVMAHGADPWWRVAIRLIEKHPNLYMMTSAWAPRYLPDELVQAMNRRLRGKVMFATDYPMLDLRRCVREAGDLDLEPEAMASFLATTALDLFFTGDSS
jgi:predicted TIM-barrel fold metal-dependent hydrolase